MILDSSFGVEIGLLQGLLHTPEPCRIPWKEAYGLLKAGDVCGAAGTGRDGTRGRSALRGGSPPSGRWHDSS